MDSVIYLLSILLTLCAYALGGWLVWQAIEVGYWIYCKIKRIEY